MKLRVLLLVLILGLCGQAEAKVYRYLDPNGVVHFTDNPLNVPPGSKPLEPSGKTVLNTMESKQPGEPGSGKGAMLFAEKCAECHTIENNAPEGKISLFSTVISSETLMPVSEGELIRSLRRAVSGAYSDMDAIGITDEELKAIASYLLRAVK